LICYGIQGGRIGGWGIEGRADRVVWDQRGDIRDVISIGKLVRKNDSPEAVEQIISTMTKYGDIKEH
jgi:hypothetical protein